MQRSLWLIGKKLGHPKMDRWDNEIRQNNFFSRVISNVVLLLYSYFNNHNFLCDKIMLMSSITDSIRLPFQANN
jgi:hypothetical protein